MWIGDWSECFLYDNCSEVEEWLVVEWAKVRSRYLKCSGKLVESDVWKLLGNLRIYWCGDVFHIKKIVVYTAFMAIANLRDVRLGLAVCYVERVNWSICIWK